MDSELTDQRTSPQSELQFSKILREVNRKLNNGIPGRDVFDFLFESLDIIIPFDRIGIALIEGEGHDLKVCAKWARSKVPTSHLTVGYCAPLKGSSLEKVLQTGKPRIINDLVSYLREHPKSKSTELIIKDGIRSSLTCPLRSEGKNIGLIFFSSTLEGTYTNEHVQTYLEIADEVSVIVSRERLRSAAESGQSLASNFRTVLHDLKAPLGVIEGFLDLTEGEAWFKSLDPDAKDIFAVLKRNSHYMRDLLNELSELRSLDSKSANEKREMNLAEFIGEFAIRGRELAVQKEIGFSIATDPNLPRKLKLNRTGILRVFDNLITNAVKYSARGGEIHVQIKLLGRRLIIEVSDTGQGIPLAEQKNLFREFGRTSVRPTEGEQSTGLGLAIAQKIVHQHGGEITVRSEPGMGSTFSFWLPSDIEH